jgi:peroxiredoxin
MTKLGLGRIAPDVRLMTLDGRSQQLSSFWGSGQPLLLIFLRHLA